MPELLPRLLIEREACPFPEVAIGRIVLPGGARVALFRRPGDNRLVLLQQIIEVPEPGDDPVPPGEACVIEQLVAVHPGADEIERGMALFAEAVEAALEVI